MLRVGNEQMQAIAREVVLDFEYRMLEIVKAFLSTAKAQADRTELQTIIHEGIARARSHGLFTEQGIGLYICVVALDSIWGSSPECAQILAVFEREHASEGSKMEEVFGIIVPEGC